VAIKNEYMLLSIKQLVLVSFAFFVLSCVRNSKENNPITFTRQDSILINQIDYYNNYIKSAYGQKVYPMIVEYHIELDTTSYLISCFDSTAIHCLVYDSIKYYYKFNNLQVFSKYKIFSFDGITNIDSVWEKMNKEQYDYYKKHGKFKSPPSIWDEKSLFVKLKKDSIITSEITCLDHRTMIFNN
jgi:hypothetical protein